MGPIAWTVAATQPDFMSIRTELDFQFHKPTLRTEVLTFAKLALTDIIAAFARTGFGRIDI